MRLASLLRLTIRYNISPVSEFGEDGRDDDDEAVDEAAAATVVSDDTVDDAAVAAVSFFDGLNEGDVPMLTADGEERARDSA